MIASVHDCPVPITPRLFSSRRSELFCTKPVPLISDDAVGEISASFENGQSGLDRQPIGHNSGAVDQAINCTRDICSRSFITAAEHPNKFAKDRDRHRNTIGLLAKPCPLA